MVEEQSLLDEKDRYETMLEPQVVPSSCPGDNIRTDKLIFLGL